MHNLVISDETADSLFREIFIQDYRRLRDDIYALENRDRDDIDDEDLANDRKYFSAMRDLMEYYIGYNWQRVVGDE